MPSVLPSRRHSFNTRDARTADLIKSAINEQFVPEEELVPNIMGLRAYSEHRIASSSFGVCVLYSLAWNLVGALSTAVKLRVRFDSCFWFAAVRFGCDLSLVA